MSLDTETDVIQAHDREHIYQGLFVAGCKSSEESEPLIRGLLLEKDDHKRENYDEVERVGTLTLFSGVMSGLYDSLGAWNS